MKRLTDEQLLGLVEELAQGNGEAKASLVAYIQEYRLSGEVEAKLVKCLARGVAGIQDLLSLYIKCRDPLFPETAEIELAECFANGLKGTKELLLAYIKNTSLPDDAEVCLLRSFTKGVEGAKEVIEAYFALYPVRCASSVKAMLFDSFFAREAPV